MKNNIFSVLAESDLVSPVPRSYYYYQSSGDEQTDLVNKGFCQILSNIESQINAIANIEYQDYHEAIED